MVFRNSEFSIGETEMAEKHFKMFNILINQ